MILQDWDEIEALQESLREHMAEIKRLNECLTWEQHRAEHIGTHGPGCAEWGPKHYECLLRAHKALKEQIDRSADTGKTSDHIPDAGKMVASVRESKTVEATIKDCLTVEPVAYISGYKQGYCVIEPVDRNVLLSVGMALYRLPPKREPLTEEQIESAVCNAYVEKALTRYDITIARAIERAHGIGGEE